jgi:hypothetical protein
MMSTVHTSETRLLELMPVSGRCVNISKCVRRYRESIGLLWHSKMKQPGILICSKFVALPSIWSYQRRRAYAFLWRSRDRWRERLHALPFPEVQIRNKWLEEQVMTDPIALLPLTESPL